jgi:hypothetical protein
VGKRRKVQNVFDDALSKFLEIEGDHLLSNVSERNTCGRLLYYLQQQILDDGYEGYFVDTEYNRKQDGKIKTILNEQELVVNITTDLIVHSRGRFNRSLDNLIAIEAKKISRPDHEKVQDRNRLTALTKDPSNQVWSYDGETHPEHVCGYELGVYIIIDINQRLLLLEYYGNGMFTHQGTSNF